MLWLCLIIQILKSLLIYVHFTANFYRYHTSINKAKILLSIILEGLPSCKSCFTLLVRIPITSEHGFKTCTSKDIVHLQGPWKKSFCSMVHGTNTQMLKD